MVLVDWLYSAGGKLGLLHVVNHEPPKAPAAPEKIKTRTIQLKDLVAEIQADEVRSLAQKPEELSVSFDKVFETAGIKPGAGDWTIEKLRDLLRSEPYRSMDRETAQKALAASLADKKVSVEDLVKDAMARDKALDAYEEVARGKMNARSQTRQLRQAEIQSQLDDLQRQGEQLKQEQTADEHLWLQWHGGKVDFEKEMAWAVGYLLDRPVVTIDEPHSAANPSRDRLYGIP